MNSVLVLALIPIILSIGIIPVFAEHAGNHHEKKMMDRMSDKHHHMSFNGICAPGFAALNEMCVLDDRCGPGAYPGKLCMMDGTIKQYLKPHHQKHAGISVDNIICAEGKELIFKNHNASPACVNSDSVEKLKHRGWQTEKPVIACTMEYNPVCGVDGTTYGNMCGLNSQHMKMKHQGECTATPSITNFEQCIAAGNPAMESHPRQCRTAEGDHFVEEISMQEMGKIFPNTLEDTEKILAMDEFAGILNKLNQDSISYQKNSDQKEFEKNKVLMSKKQAEIASKILKVDISDAYVAEGWNFPFRDISEVNIINPEFNKPICNIPERIPYHLQKIQQSEMFQIFVGKYSGYELKIDISDERNHEGLIHYDLIATSESESFTASTYFHLDSCTEEMKWPYFLWCKDNQKDEHISTKIKSEIISSIEKNEFCSIEFESWHQNIRDYQLKISSELDELGKKLENTTDEKESYEISLELRRLGQLNNIIRHYESGYTDSPELQEDISKYNKIFGDIPEELKLITKKI